MGLQVSRVVSKILRKRMAFEPKLKVRRTICILEGRAFQAEGTESTRP